MTPPSAADAIRRRNRRMLLALFLLFFGGMLLAGVLRFSGWRPEGSKNRGEMLQPYGDLRGYVPTLARGDAYRWNDEPRIWRIAAIPRDCDGARADPCTRLLADLDKVWRLMGKDADRVHILWARCACCAPTTACARGWCAGTTPAVMPRGWWTRTASWSCATLPASIPVTCAPTSPAC